MKIFFLFIFLSFSQAVFSQDVYVHAIEDEKQLSFPGLTVDGSEKIPVSYYSMKLEAEEGKNGEIIRYEEKINLPAGTKAKLSSYIIAKEMFEALKINSIANKASEEEMKLALNSNDPAKQYAFFLKVAEKWRVPENEEEIEALTKKVKARKTKDDPESTPALPTGFIEVIPEKTKSFNGKEDTRFFVPLKDIKNLSLNANGDLKFRKAIGILAFKRLKIELSFGDLDDKVIEKLDKIDANLALGCTDNCLISKNFPKLGDFSVNVLKAVTKASKNEKMLVGEEYNNKILQSLAELIKTVFGGCPEIINTSFAKTKK